jgi:hypothetical protein
MPKINIKKYSRSNVDTTETESEIPEQMDNNIIVKKRGRPKKEQIQQEIIQEPSYEAPQLIETEPETHEFEPLETELDPFLDELTNEHYQEPPTEKEQRELEREFKEQLKEQTKAQKKHETRERKVNNIMESNDLFDETGTEIIGRDRRVIINKMNQYKSLFPKELAKFKVKKGASIEELQAYLQEMSTIVECSSYDNFLSDSILQTIKLIEGGTKATRYDITGCADMLKANPQFNNLLKQLYVKYNVFHKIPPEIQMVLLISTTSYICINKNKNKHLINEYLNAPMNGQ